MSKRSMIQASELGCFFEHTLGSKTGETAFEQLRGYIALSNHGKQPKYERERIYYVDADAGNISKAKKQLEFGQAIIIPTPADFIKKLNQLQLESAFLMSLKGIKF